MLFIMISDFVQYLRVGLKRNFNRKGGRYNDKQPIKGVREVALLCTVICPERLSAGGVVSGSW